jgi:hypothetical protein
MMIWRRIFGVFFLLFSLVIFRISESQCSPTGDMFTPRRWIVLSLRAISRAQTKPYIANFNMDIIYPNITHKLPLKDFVGVPPRMEIEPMP